MIHDLGRGDGLVVSTDVCVVGAGPAGIALSLALARAGVDVILLESGGLGFEAETHDLNRGEVLSPDSHGSLEAYRRRCLGGASTAWGGRSAAFDAHDFEARAHVPGSGWPFSKAALDPYYGAAHALCELGAFTYRAEQALPDGACRRPFIPGLDTAEIDTGGLYLFSRPVDFGAHHRAALAESARVRVFLHAECTRLVVDREGGRVSLCEAASLHGGRLLVAARRFVLAGGGLEVTRLLLRSNDVHKEGIGNHSDMLGRHYMCHLIHRFEIEARSPDVVLDYEVTRQGVYCQRALSVRPEVQSQEGLLNHRARIEHPDIADPAHKSGVLSAAYLVKSALGAGLSEELAHRASALSRGVLREEQRAHAELAAHLGNVVRDAPAVIGYSRRWVRERILGRRKLPSLTMKSPDGIYTLRLDLEQAPNPESRVMLGADRDAFGQRRLRVDWRPTALDAWSAVRTGALIGKALSRSGAGRLRELPGFSPEATGGHHLGTTRMSADPAKGVVDPTCRVHGMANLHVASSSVFPTSSYANPTLTVLALALRLADHLAAARTVREIGREAGV